MGVGGRVSGVGKIEDFSVVDRDIFHRVESSWYRLGKLRIVG